MKFSSLIIAGVASMMVVSCQQHGTTSADNGRKLLDPANMDTTVRPGDNFFEYANGTWLKNNPIPPDKTRWGSFDELGDNNLKKLHFLLDSAAAVKDAPQGSGTQKVGDFYKSGMDSATIEKAGLAPLNDIMTRINNIKDVNGLIAEIATEHTEGVGPLFGFDVSPDDKDVTKEICQFGQSGLGMPDRDYYFDKDARTVKIRDAYKEYLPKMFVLMGNDAAAAKKAGADVYDLETKLAKASMGRVEERDPYKVYNKFNLDGINKETPGLDWKTLFTELKVNGQDSLIVGMPGFFKEVAVQFKATPLDVWKEYLKFHLVNNMSSYLSSAFDTTHFAFYGEVMSGQKIQTPRWKRVLRVVDGSIGDLLGKMYVDKYFTSDAKQHMLDLVNNLQAAYAERIKTIDWMSDSTKKKALIKLDAFVKKIGYTDKWKDYTFAVVPDNYIKNILVSSAWEYDYDLNKLGKPVDRSVWDMTPPTVNAYYNPTFNEIVFPAGILQFPFYDPNADDAVNYGGIGAVIGHEMTHGFDDQGRLYAADGNLGNWWSPQDSANFVKKAGVMVNQFDQAIVIDTMHANGALEEGENLADLGGLNIAYAAFKKTKEGQSNEKIDGFTPDQRFFLSWAQVWRGNTRPEALAARLKTDPHAATQLRCNMPVSNMEAWYKAFDVKPGDKMYRKPEDRARVW